MLIGCKLNNVNRAFWWAMRFTKSLWQLQPATDRLSDLDIHPTAAQGQAFVLQGISSKFWPFLSHIPNDLLINSVNLRASLFLELPFRRRGVIYAQNYFPAKVQCVFMSIILKLFHSPHLKPVLVQSYCHPPHANEAYQKDLCDMFEKTSDRNAEIWLSGDLNINLLCQLSTKKNNVFSLIKWAWTSGSYCHSAKQNKYRQWTSCLMIQFYCLCSNCFL